MDGGVVGCWNRVGCGRKGGGESRRGEARLTSLTVAVLEREGSMGVGGEREPQRNGGVNDCMKNEEQQTAAREM